MPINIIPAGFAAASGGSMGFLSKLIPAAGNLLGGLFGSKSAADANAENIKLQKQFAQQGIRWKVADAKAAGIHPLYALGAQTTSFQPSSVGDPLGGALADMGQNIGRAIDSTATAGERATGKAITALNLERAGLENELLRTQIARERGQIGPPFPSAATTDPNLSIGGVPIKIDPSTSSAQKIQDRYGEPAEWIASPMIAWQDFKKNMEGKSFLDIIRMIDRNTKVFGQ